jgi:hypothetical protein
MTDRMQLAKKSALWQNDVPTDAKEFYFIPRIFLLREFDIVPAKVKDAVDIDMEITPLYIAPGQVVTMAIIDGKFQIRVTAADSQGSAENRGEV